MSCIKVCNNAGKHAPLSERMTMFASPNFTLKFVAPQHEALYVSVHKAVVASISQTSAFKLNDSNYFFWEIPIDDLNTAEQIVCAMYDAPVDWSRVHFPAWNHIASRVFHAPWLVHMGVSALSQRKCNHVSRVATGTQPGAHELSHGPNVVSNTQIREPNPKHCPRALYNNTPKRRRKQRLAAIRVAFTPMQLRRRKHPRKARQRSRFSSLR